jgi:hypothetical protein
LKDLRFQGFEISVFYEIEVFRYLGIKASGFQGIYVLRVRALSVLKFFRNQGFEVSKNQGFSVLKFFRYQGFEVSKNQGFSVLKFLGFKESNVSGF